MHYNYCPQCGTKLIDKEAGDNGYIPYCPNCNNFYFDTFGCCSIVMIVNEYNEIALLKQKHLSSNHLTFISGYIELGENAETCAIREVSEELGITINSLEACGTYWYPKKELLMHGFIAYANKTSFNLSKEIDAAYWIHFDEAKAKMVEDKPGNVMHQLYRYYQSKYIKME